eukprot:COSAG05_NODE_532_length_8897_cov_18.622301_2_plen_159_part_00
MLLINHPEQRRQFVAALLAFAAPYPRSLWVNLLTTGCAAGYLNGDGNIGFSTFFAVMCGTFELGELVESSGRTQDEQLNQMSMQEMRNLFLQMDEDKSGYLDRYEVQQLAGKVGHQIASRHLVDAMKAMDPEGTNMVSFDMFRNWLIDAGGVSIAEPT